MDKKSIIQWNFRGLKANYNEILILTTLLSPTVFCLQETFLKTTDNIYFKNYSLYNHIAIENQKASGGSSILVKSNVPHRQIDINSNLQAVAVNVTLSKSITICSLYLPPHCKFSKHDLENLINQLPRPYLLLGDFNSHSKLWQGLTNPLPGRPGQVLNPAGQVCSVFTTPGRASVKKSPGQLKVRVFTVKKSDQKMSINIDN